MDAKASEITFQLIFPGVQQNETCKDRIQNPGKTAAKQGTGIPHQEIHLVYNQLVFSI